MVRSLAQSAALVLGLLLCAPPQAAASRRIVKFHGAVPNAERVRIASAAGGRIVRELPLIDAVVIEADDAQISAAGSRLLALPQVARVDEDPRVNWLKAVDGRGVDFRLPSPAAIVAAASAPRRPAAGQELPWGVARVQAPSAWAASRGAGVKLAVIDTGIDRFHPDLRARVRGGWNALADSGNFADDNGHGSHCAGTVGASDDAQGVVGVAPSVDLYGVKVLDARGAGNFDDVIAGMQWAAQNGMRVVSMSLGTPIGNPALEDAVNALVAREIILVAAAGNTGGAVGYPAAYAGAIAVAASDSQSRLASFSSRGPQVALIAPGVDIKSTYMGGAYETLSGTSMAAPHVAGLAALYASTHPGAGPAAARAALAASATRLPGIPTRGQGAGLPVAPRLVR